MGAWIASFGVRSEFRARPAIVIGRGEEEEKIDAGGAGVVVVKEGQSMKTNGRFRGSPSLPGDEDEGAFQERRRAREIFRVRVTSAAA